MIWFELFFEVFFQQKFSNCHLLYFSWRRNQNLTQSRFKNQTIDSLKLLDLLRNNCDIDKILPKIPILIKRFTKFCLKTTMMENNIFSLTRPCWWLLFWISIFNVPPDWFLSLFGVIVLTSSTLKVQQAMLREFS